VTTPPPNVADFRCRECGWANGHGTTCSIAVLAAERAAARRSMQLHAERHWVRALFVAAAERTQRGLVESGFVFFSGAPVSDPTPRLVRGRR
jgi:hypothetical protein